MRFTVIGDVGVQDGMLHVGDEAMFEAAVLAFRSRGVDVVGVSAAPRETAHRYGIRAIDRIGGWGADRGANTGRLAAVLGDRGRLDRDDPAGAVAEAVRGSDAVVIAGGGNLASTWPLHVFERAALGGLAAAAGVPLLVTGQTIGPALIGQDRSLVGGMLASAAVVGVRERRSLALARALGVHEDRLRLGIDDASLLPPGDRPPPATGDTCLVTVANHTGGFERAEVQRALAALLDHVAATTGLRIVLLGHFAPLEGAPRGDEVVHETIRSLMRAPATSVRVADARAAADRARGAALVLTSRYHPAVFAAPAGVPVVAIPVDEYTAAKLGGVLDHAGQAGLLPAEALLRGEGAAAVDRVWADRAATRATATARSAGLHDETEAWWDRLVAAARPSGAAA